ncbi:lasso peptide biosynthesis PqqD family chaperone [uncultured Clostridium sp.]|uniref:lasso peptide biosynthesis PqqD family chaperone n=1 Tax=uncultured Clostridium sp. TaxID=59620 RepID=UPI0025D416E3|nr:lasso peptide biosynthesis PqqD family chaperone [uncultured Clostridium sp.]
MNRKNDKQIINDESIIRKNIEIDDADLDGEKVMMNLDKGKYFSLNEVGSRIWTIISTSMSIKGITDILIKEYDVDYETCKVEVIKFIKKLYEDDLIEIN